MQPKARLVREVGWVRPSMRRPGSLICPTSRPAHPHASQKVFDAPRDGSDRCENQCRQLPPVRLAATPAAPSSPRRSLHLARPPVSLRPQLRWDLPELGRRSRRDGTGRLATYRRARYPLGRAHYSPASARLNYGESQAPCRRATVRFSAPRTATGLWGRILRMPARSPQAAGTVSGLLAGKP